MSIIEQQIIDWDGDRTLLPLIPENDNDKKAVEELYAKMDVFVEQWNPSPPEGKGWSLVEKKWFCTSPCDRCGVDPDVETGHCPHQGVRPQSVWVRTIKE